MKTNFLCLAAVIGLSACADYRVVQAEKKSSLRIDAVEQPDGHPATLAGYSAQARLLSVQYVTAAKKTQTTQDILSAILTIAAGKAVIDAVSDEADRKVAELIVAGGAARELGKRAAPKASIASMYGGATKMNCIAIGASLGASRNGYNLPSNAAAEFIAVEITKGAMFQVMIETRSGLVREVGDYSALLGSFLKDVKTAADQAGTFNIDLRAGDRSKVYPGVEQKLIPGLEAYISYLAGCMSAKNPAASVPKESKPPTKS